MENAFFLQAPEYKRDISVLTHANKQAAMYLHKRTGKPFDYCLDYVKRQTQPGGKFAIKDPMTKMFERGENGDREKVVVPFTTYLRNAISNREIIAGTLTTYLHPDVMESEVTGYLEDNIKGRAQAKHRMFEAIANNDAEAEVVAFTEQNGKKTTNNAMSGAQAAKSTPLYNVTGHSTLTSTCRMTSGYGNANNEKFIIGNRHYWSYDIVLNNIMSIISNSNYELIEKVMTQYGMIYPTVNDCMDCVTYSSKFYWNKRESLDNLRSTFESLEPIERAAFVYTGDFYHIAKHNGGLVRELLRRLTTRVDKEIENPAEVLKQAYSDVKIYACLICTEFLKGTKLENIKGTKEYLYYVSTVKSIMDTINDYFYFFRAFMVTDNVPASVSYFPDSTRRIVVASDTDSTIYTVEDWVRWYCGKIRFTAEANAISDAIVFLSSQSIVHVLARMSANLGVPEKRIFQIAMKNEFKFDVFVPAQVGKHYYAVKSSQEGIIFDKLKKEIKGVHLKSSSSPKEVIDQAENMMLDICHTVMDEREIDIQSILKQIGDTERKIYDSIIRGDSSYFRKAIIKPASSYKNGESTAAFKQYKLWNDIFGPKYGMAQEPPYNTIKVNVRLDKPTNTSEWLLSLQDKELANRALAYMKENEKNFLGGTIYVPENIAVSQGIPKEIVDVASIRELIKGITNPFYIILETLGVYMLNDKITRLVMDTH